MLKMLVLIIGAAFAITGIVLFAKKGVSGKNTIKMLGAEFQLSGSSLVIFVLGCLLIIFAAQLDNTEPSTKPEGAGNKTALLETSPDFVTDYVFDQASIERIEYEVETGKLPEENIDAFLRLVRVALAEDHQTFNVRLLIKNTSMNPIRLDLDNRFFRLEDNQGRKANMIYFCCVSKGDLLGPGQEREVQMFFQSSGWYGKELTASSIFFRVSGFLPLIRATWKMPTVAVLAGSKELNQYITQLSNTVLIRKTRQQGQVFILDRI